MSVEVNPQYEEEIKKSEEKKIKIDSEGAVFSFLDNLRKQDLPKDIVNQIDLQLKNLEKGETEAVVKFLSQMALEMAKNDFGIQAENFHELGDRLAEARVGLEEDIRNKQEELQSINQQLEEMRAEGEPWEVKELELKALQLYEELRELHLKKEDNFSRIQDFMDAVDALEK